MFKISELLKELKAMKTDDYNDVLKRSNSEQAKSEAQMVKDIVSGKIKRSVNKHNNLVFDTGANVITINWIDFDDCTCAVTIDENLYDGDVETLTIGSRTYTALSCGGEVVLVFISKEVQK